MVQKVLLFFSFTWLTCFGQDWKVLPDFSGGYRDDGVGFSIVDVGYVGAGRDDGFQYRKDFYKYENGSWSQISTMLGNPLQYATSFSIDGLGFVVNGIDNNGAMLKQLQCYNPLNDTWTIKSEFPDSARMQSVSFIIGNMAYVGTGRNYSTDFSDFYTYDYISDSWESIEKLPEPRHEAVSFSIGGKGYVGIGQDLNGNYYNSFYAYNPLSNKWTSIADFPGNIRSYAIGFSLGDKGYVCTGLDENNTVSSEFWEYDPKKDEWSQMADFPFTPIKGSSLFTINNCAHLINGIDNNSVRSDKHYSVCSQSPTPNVVSCYPNPFSEKLAILYSISSESSVSYELVNLFGSVCRTGILSSSYTELDLHGLSKGVYLLRVVSEEETMAVIKVVKV